jgi:hypothetical protein
MCESDTIVGDTKARERRPERCQTNLDPTAVTSGECVEECVRNQFGGDENEGAPLVGRQRYVFDACRYGDVCARREQRAEIVHHVAQDWPAGLDPPLLTSLQASKIHGQVVRDYGIAPGRARPVAGRLAMTVSSVDQSHQAVGPMQRLLGEQCPTRRAFHVPIHANGGEKRIGDTTRQRRKRARHTCHVFEARSEIVRRLSKPRVR